jgi:hypothetical protein
MRAQERCSAVECDGRERRQALQLLALCGAEAGADTDADYMQETWMRNSLDRSAICAMLLVTAAAAAAAQTSPPPLAVPNPHYV